MPLGTYIPVGRAVDTAVNQNLEHRILTGDLLLIDEIEDIARTAAEFEWKNSDIVLSAEEKKARVEATKAATIAKAIRLAQLHATEIAPKLLPTHVQRKWSLEITGLPFDVVGTIDVQEGAIAIRDTKTSGKSPAANIAEMSDQLSMYFLAIQVIDGVAPQFVALDYLIDNKVPVARTYTSTRDASDMQAMIARLENAAEIIQKGAFTPARPTDWVCSQKWCGFFSSCKFAKRPKTVFMEGD